MKSLQSSNMSGRISSFSLRSDVIHTVPFTMIELVVRIEYCVAVGTVMPVLPDELMYPDVELSVNDAEPTSNGMVLFVVFPI